MGNISGITTGLGTTTTGFSSTDAGKSQVSFYALKADVKLAVLTKFSIAVVYRELPGNANY